MAHHFDYDVIVIGGGAAGLTASGIAATLGARTALVERERTGGECTWSGCVPSKTLLKAARVVWTMRTADRYGLAAVEPEIDFGRVMAAMRATRDRIHAAADAPEHLRLRNIDVIEDEAVFVDSHTLGLRRDGGRLITARYFIICTGSSPVIPHIPGLPADRVLTNANVFELNELPASLLVIGGGPMGAELSQVFGRFGSRVTVVEQAPEILPCDEPECSAFVRGRLEQEGIRFQLGSRVDAVAHDDRGYHAQVITGENWNTVRFDRVLVASGRRPNVLGLGLEAAGVVFDEKGIQINHSCQTSIPHIYACGDVTNGLHLTHVAEDMARTAVMRILLKLPAAYERRSVPRVTFTDPESAHLGRTAAELHEKGVRFETINFPYDRIDRAVTDHADGGFVLLHISPIAGKIHGAHIVGARAGEMINEFTLAMRNGLSLRTISSTVHAYPTYLLGARRAADQWYVRQSSPKLLGLLKLLFGYRGKLPDSVGTDEIV